MSNYKTQAAQQKEMKKAMSKWMIWHKIPMRDEVARRERLIAMEPDQCFKYFFGTEVKGRAWEKEFLAIFEACLDGKKNERRREELLKQFMAPFPNRDIDDTEDGYVIDRDGYTPRGLVLMHVAIGLAYSGEVSDHAPSSSATAYYRQYREWIRNLFPDYKSEHCEDLGREDTLGGGFYYYGEATSDNLCWDPEFFMFNEGFVRSNGVQQYIRDAGVMTNDVVKGGLERYTYEEGMDWLVFWRDLMTASSEPPHDVWTIYDLERQAQENADSKSGPVHDDKGSEKGSDWSEYDRRQEAWRGARCQERLRLLLAETG